MSFGLCFFFRRRFFVGVFMVVVFSALRECTGDLTLLPNNPAGVVGEDMHLNCTLTKETLDWRDLVFTIVNYGTFEHHPIPATDIRNLSDWSVEVTLRNLTESQHLATVFCRYRIDSQFDESQIITVGRPPAVPIIEDYRYLNWKEFVFRWKIPPTNGFPTTYIAWVKTSNDNDFTPCTGPMCVIEDKSKCRPYQVNDACHISEEGFLYEASRDGFLQFKVNATNLGGSATSETITCFYEDVIQPGPITELKVSSRFRKGVARYVDVVSLRSQKQSVTFDFEIRMKSKEKPAHRRKIFKGVQSGEQPHITLDLQDLHVNPFSFYNLSIRSKVKEAGRTGFWSEWSNATFTSHEEVPLKAPAVCQCCFEVDEGSVQRTAFIYFKPLTKEESRGKVSYDLEYTTVGNRGGLHLNSTGRDNEVAFPFNRTQRTVNDNSISERIMMVQGNNSVAAVFRLNLLKSVPYLLNVNAKTNAGHSPTKSTTVLIPTRSTESELKLLEPPTNCSVMSVDGMDEKRIVFRWNNMTSSGEHALKTVTIFWCKAFLNSMRCQQPLNWLELDPKETHVDVTLPDSYEGYRFGIGQVLENNFSSGIHWTCSYFKKNAVASPPHLVQLETDETSVVVKLEKPNYNPMEGLVYGFNLYYSSVDDEGQQQEKKVYVADAYDEDRSTQGLVKIKGLKRGTLYTFEAETLTAAGPSYRNASVNIVTQPYRLPEHALGWIIFGAVVVGILALVGFSCCIRWPHEQWNKLKRWIKFEPCMPSVVLDEREEKQRNSSYPAYSLVSETTAFNNKLNQMVEDDQVETDRHSEDLVPAYSCITTRREECMQKRRLSDEMDMLNIGFRNPVPDSTPEHVLPLLHRLPDIAIHKQLLPNLAEMSEQSISEQPDQSPNGTTISSDVDQTSSSDCYASGKTVDNSIKSLTSNEKSNPVSQHMVNQVLPADNQSANFDIANHVLSKHPTLSTNSQPANDNLQNHMLPSPNELVRQDMTCQILPSTTQPVRNSILPELGQKADGSIADRILPISSQRMNVNVLDTDLSRPTRTDQVLQPPARLTFDRSEIDRPSVVLLSSQCIVNDNAKPSEQIEQRMIDHVEPSQQRILPRLLETDRDLNTRAETNNLAKLQKNPTQTWQRGKDGSSTFVATSSSDMAAISSIAEVHGRNERSRRAMRDSFYSPSSSSSSADETSTTSEEDSGSRQAKPYAPNSLEDDEGIYL